MKTLSPSEITSHLENLDGWIFAENCLEKKFSFPGFIQALGFIVKVGVLAEKNNHHPELWNVYNKLTIRLSTHDAGGVTQKDIDLAAAIDHME